MQLTYSACAEYNSYRARRKPIENQKYQKTIDKKHIEYANKITIFKFHKLVALTRAENFIRGRARWTPNPKMSCWIFHKVSTIGSSTFSTIFPQ